MKIMKKKEACKREYTGNREVEVEERRGEEVNKRQ